MNEMLPLLKEALMELPHDLSSDEVQISIRCPYCGGSSNHPDKKSFSIKIEPEPGEPVLCRCWRASCGYTGYLKTTDLATFGITDMDVIMELSAYNRTINKNLDRPFVSRSKREFELINLHSENSDQKLAYLNRRLGQKLEITDLRLYKIQLGLYDLLEINSIKRLAFPKDTCDLLDQHCIGFISIYNDYLICRDISKGLLSGKRYTNYRISGKPDPNDMKIYSIPRELDIMDPRSFEINIAEGPFSILGAYLNTDIGNERPNSAWLANCGSDYRNTILHICKQYGLLKVRLNIFSDSEIKLAKYQQLLRSFKDQLDVRSCVVYYNVAAEDFGHPKKEIKVEKSTLK